MDMVKNLESVLHNPVPFVGGGGQTISDRFNAAKHSLAGSQLGKTVCKATTEECVGPKKKHLDYLLHCTHEANVSIPQLANLLIERAQNEHWCVSFKSLITIHNLMCYGNERFSQYLASCNARLELDNFMDTKASQGYDMSMHVRQYANYITEKIKSYRMMAFDFCKVKRGCDDGLLRAMSYDNLQKTLPVLTGQIDALLAFKVEKYNLNNGIINSAFILLFRDLIRLFACYNDGVINTLGKYFDMPKKQCKDALKSYKEFLGRMDGVREFFYVAEAVGIDKSDIPDLAAAPASLLTSLENHLAQLEGKPVEAVSSTVTSPTATAGVAIHQLSTGVDASRVDERTKQRLLDEEQRRLDQLKQQREVNGAPKFNPFADSAPAAPAPARPPPPPSHNVDELLDMSSANPFSSAVSNGHSQQQQQQQQQHVVKPPPSSTSNHNNNNNVVSSSSRHTADLHGLFGEQQPQQQPSASTQSMPPSSSASLPLQQLYAQSSVQQQQQQSYSQATYSAHQTTMTYNSTAPAQMHNGSVFSADFGRHFAQPSLYSPTGGPPSSGGGNPFASSSPAPARPPPAAAAFNPFASGAGTPPPAASRPPPPGGRPPPPGAGPARNPFGDAHPPPPPPSHNPFGAAGAPPPRPPPTHSPSPARPPPVSRPPPPHSSPFNDDHRSHIEYQGVDPLGDVLQPSGSSNPFAAGGPPPRPNVSDSKLITRDVDSSLANLSSNLSLEGSRVPGANRPVQWGASNNPFA